MNVNENRLHRIAPESRRQLLVDADRNLRSMEAALETARAQRETVRGWFRDAGLGHEVTAYDTPPPVVHRKPSRMVRVRALEGFSTQPAGDNMTWALAPHQVGDIPEAVATALARNGVVELVDPATPITGPVIAR